MSQTETSPHDPAILAVVKKTTHYDRPLGGIMGEFDKKNSMSEAQRFVDERLAITRKVRDAMASAQDKQKQYADKNGRKNNERFKVGKKVLLNTSTLPKMQFMYYLEVLRNYCRVSLGHLLWSRKWET